jgi:hypothetical protein
MMRIIVSDELLKFQVLLATCKRALMTVGLVVFRGILAETGKSNTVVPLFPTTGCDICTDIWFSTEPGVELEKLTGLTVQTKSTSLIYLKPVLMSMAPLFHGRS